METIILSALVILLYFSAKIYNIAVEIRENQRFAEVNQRNNNYLMGSQS